MALSGQAAWLHNPIIKKGPTMGLLFKPNGVPYPYLCSDSENPSAFPNLGRPCKNTEGKRYPQKIIPIPLPADFPHLPPSPQLHTCGVTYKQNNIKYKRKTRRKQQPVS